MMLVKGLSHCEPWKNVGDHLDTGTVGEDTVQCLKVGAWKLPSQALPTYYHLAQAA